MSCGVGGSVGYGKYDLGGIIGLGANILSMLKSELFPAAAAAAADKIPLW